MLMVIKLFHTTLGGHPFWQGFWPGHFCSGIKAKPWKADSVPSAVLVQRDVGPSSIYSHHDLLDLEGSVALCTLCTCGGSGTRHMSVFFLYRNPEGRCTFPPVYQCLRFLLCTLRSQSKFCYFSYLSSQMYFRCISILQHGFDAG